MTARISFSFLPDGGETGALIRAIDWRLHPLGAPKSWPSSLKATLSVMLGSRYPMILWWGPKLYQFYNDGFIAALGEHKHPGAMGQRGKVCWAEAWPLIAQQIDDVLTHGKPSWNENHCVPVSRQGKIEEAFWTYGYSPVTQEDGQVVGVLNIVTETTQQVQATRALQKTTTALADARLELYRFLMQVPLGIAVLSGSHHVFTLVNPVFSAMAHGGRPISDFLGKSVREALPELEGQGFFEILDNVYRTGEPFLGAKLRASMRQANGIEHELFFNFTYQARRDDKGHIEGIVAVIYEVTDAVNEHKEIELLANSLRSAVSARDLFLGVASHELNTPLTSLMLQSEMFARRLDRDPTDALTPVKTRKFVNDVFLQAKRLERLVNAMLDVSRLAVGKLSMLPCRANLSVLMNETLDRFTPRLQLAGILLQREVAPGIYANIDAHRIEQVLSNLLVNAIQYAPKAALRATLVQHHGKIHMTLRDDGPGIAPEHHERIFGRFERATHPNEVSGLGLGLYISEQIIQAHGGDISVHSATGSGTTFVCELPALSDV